MTGWKDKMNSEPECPECDKMLAVKDDSQTIGFFLEWLESKGYSLIQWGKSPYILNETSIERILADYFEIDLNKVHAEQDAVLEYIRSV